MAFKKINHMFEGAHLKKIVPWNIYYVFTDFLF